MLKAVVFDFDGVLFNTAKYYLKTREIYFKKHGIKFTKKEHKENLATTTKDFFNLVSKKHNLKIKYSDYFKEKKEIFSSFENKIKPNPGVLNLLKDLNKNKVKIALSSSNERENILFFLNKYNLKKYFNLILTSEDFKKHKPDPEAFLKPVKLLKVNPKDCVGIEDSLQGIVSINKANLKSIALLSEFTTKSDFKKLNASLIIKSLNKLSYKKLNELFKKE
jgi:beta-phosphoglucomutase